MLTIWLAGIHYCMSATINIARGRHNCSYVCLDFVWFDRGGHAGDIYTCASRGLPMSANGPEHISYDVQAATSRDCKSEEILKIWPLESIE